MTKRAPDGTEVFSPGDRGDVIRWTRVERALLSQLDITSDLEREFSQQGALVARWGFLRARAEGEAEALEEELSVLEAEIGRAYRRKAKGDVKETAIKEYIRTRPVRRALVRELQDARWRSRVLKIAVEAFEHRKAMLMMLGADRRHEYSSMSLRMKRASEIVRQSARRRLNRAQRGAQHQVEEE